MKYFWSTTRSSKLHSMINISKEKSIKNTGKVLAFFGTEIGQRGNKVLREAFRSGYNLVALDLEAITVADVEKLPYTLIEDWLQPEKIIQAKMQATECEKKWFQAARDEFIINGVCWPEFDREAMYWFWPTISLSNAFVISLHKHGIKKLKYFQNKPLRPAEYFYLTDVHTVYWHSCFAGAAEEYFSGLDEFKNFKHRLYSHLSTIRNRLTQLAHTTCRLPFKNSVSLFPQKNHNKNDNNSVFDVSRADITGKIVIVLNSGEAYRFKNQISEINSKFKKGDCIAVLFGCRKETAQAAPDLSVPVFFWEYPDADDQNIIKQFYRGYEKILQDENNSQSYNALKYLQYHFYYYFEKRWPFLNASFDSWYNLLKKQKPIAVITSTLEDSESQIPAEAANRLKIPTFAIPHGVGFTREIKPKSKHVLYNFKTDREGYIRSKISPNHLIACRNCMSQNEYPINAKHTLSKGPGKWNILVLTIPTGHNGILFKSINLSDQIKALRVIDNPPPDMNHKISIKIKPHPWIPETEIIKAAGKRLSKHVLPPNFELKTALEASDLVIALNYSGVALIHAMMAGKPIIHFLVDPSFGKVEPFAFSDIYYSSGELVHDVDKFWDVVKKFFLEPDFAKILQRKSQTFLKENLNDKNLANLGDLVFQKLDPK